MADQQSILFSTSKSEKCKYYLTGEPVSIVCQNVPSYMGGRHNPWAEANGRVGIKNVVGQKLDQKELFTDKQKASDGMLEFSAFYSTLGLSLGRSHRIAQSEGPFVFVFNDIEGEYMTHMQIDGEYYRVNKPTKIIIQMTDIFTNGRLRILKRKNEESNS